MITFMEDNDTLSQPLGEDIPTMSSNAKLSSNLFKKIWVGEFWQDETGNPNDSILEIINRSITNDEAGEDKKTPCNSYAVLETINVFMPITDSHNHAIDRVINPRMKIIEYMQWNPILTRLEEKGFKNNAARIKELMGLQDFEEGEQPLSFESTRGFQEFVFEFPVLGEPVLGIFPEGTLSAGWRIADNKHLVIEFLDSNIVSFALIGPDDNASDKKFRLNGRGDRKKIIKILSKNGVEKWPVKKV